MSCSNGIDNDSILNSVNSSKESKVNIKGEEFISEIKINNLHIWYGSIQQISENNNEIFHFGQYLSNNLDSTFDVNWVMDQPIEIRKRKKDIIEKKFSKNIKNIKNLILDDFNTYVFKLPLKKIEDPILDDPYIFPCKVTVFVNDKKRLIKIKESKVMNWSDYNTLRLNIILGLPF